MQMPHLQGPAVLRGAQALDQHQRRLASGGVAKEVKVEGDPASCKDGPLYTAVRQGGGTVRQAAAAAAARRRRTDCQRAGGAQEGDNCRLREIQRVALGRDGMAAGQERPEGEEEGEEANQHGGLTAGRAGSQSGAGAPHGVQLTNSSSAGALLSRWIGAVQFEDSKLMKS